MKKRGGKFELSATDLVGHLNCRHLTSLDRSVAEGTLAKPKVWDPLLMVLAERGTKHEQSYIDHLEASGIEVVRIDGVDVYDKAVTETLDAMRAGAQVIAQGALSDDGWIGRADILRRVDDRPSNLGDWSYEVIDTKLARETKAGAVLQLALYSDLLTQAQGVAPEYMYVVAPWSDFEPRRYRFADSAAYFRKVKRGLIDDLAAKETAKTYPDPKEYCDICRWRESCDKRRRDDDHLCLVAGISKVQINELKRREVSTVEQLATMPLPLSWKPDRGSADSYERIREQARIQVEARQSGERKFELLPVLEGLGLTRLPEPSPGDIFFDLEGDPFVGEHGLEYLFGYVFEEDGSFLYVGDWAFTREDEKKVFERFVDFVMARWETYPDLHIYHYAPYEPAAMKRLMGRYATREEEIDRMLRAGLFVDLYQVVRHTVRASVESYSIKQMEPFFSFVREKDLADAGTALAAMQTGLELDDTASISEETKEAVLAYNKDDCLAAEGLRNWLEELRNQVVARGTDVPRPEAGDGSPNERITTWILKINAIIDRLTGDIPVDPDERNDEQQARWILANILDWHRREEKALWWELFRLSDLSAEDLLDERAGLSGLSYVGNAGGTNTAPIHRYSFPPQETDLRGDEELRSQGGEKFGTVAAISFDDRTIDIKKRKDSAGINPVAIFAHKVIDTQPMKDALVRLGEYVADNGIEGDGPYQAARDLLLRIAPRTGGEPLHYEGEAASATAVRLCSHLEGGVLPIQGPPGAGKTYSGARMICELVRQGKTVGITANSHKVIRNLIDGTIEAADDLGIGVQCCHKADKVGQPQHRLTFAKRSEDLINALGGNVNVGGGTAWLWARQDAFEILDVLFVDEAAQMSLANVLAVSQAAKTVVLLGDPQQLDQPMQGTHPEGTDVSALTHILGDAHTVPADRGLFLEQTWRLHPDICAFTSELFYDDKLTSKPGLRAQVIESDGAISGSGLRYVPVHHTGNQNCSPEEAEEVSKLVNQILAGNATWIDRDGNEHGLTLDDIVIITPYNAQVFEIQQRLPGARVGTVDKFQGQEAPIAIYSMATSSHADAPRGMEFLYSLNRLNVATSRAKCISIIVSSAQLFEAECRTPRQIQLVNAFCRYVELVKNL
ncbi:conserved protein of unknown function [Candidatus Filomicrobium marinum]|uniref:Nuclease n=1 Tax=Candidatus Filomicrobium marinum TaxID=1608628 RepID=A0A0D6JJE4_9HYPH|nr:MULTISPECIES: TM0106 family RecB-like putative nuclease [Filomicrobium]MCV0370754.1 TM0106 family RecB-like putative nuclease [Filomicrobium sp.]CFX30143.1 conserved protein of unknown function [Candidatus Filomicrobium marinum]CPR22104.1 conserved protein of unknown function [Candidatus Filomicrobium marinum]